MSSLKLACKEGDLDTIEKLLKAQTPLQIRQSSSCLRMAMRTGSLAVVALLLEYGVPQSTDYFNNSPLFYASVRNSPEMVQLLLSHGATLDRRNGQGITPLMAACQYGMLGNVKVLVGNGADVNEQSCNRGKSPILHAAARYRTDVVKYLLTKGADPFLTDKVLSCVVQRLTR